MATAALIAEKRHPFAPDVYERILAFGAAILLAAMVTAILKGRADWGQIIWPVWFHLATMTVALVLTPVMLLRSRGDRLHRQLGWVWSTAMLLTAVDSLLIRQVNAGGFSFIHILSVWVVIQVPVIILSARAHNLKRHRRAVRGMVTGALLIAGFFTFPFDRLLGHWLFS
ncbi:DUF2306 domain-containing protein [Sphingomonas antarctica]|uniref:DUF2306 domain-containing protein n=1 Tax=Sphingomonas antarctica TaxID=2040274 RepID=UPI0039EB2DB4